MKKSTVSVKQSGKIIISILMVLLAFGFGKFNDNSKLTNLDIAVNEVIKEFSEEVKSTHALHCASEGGQMAHGIDTIEVYLQHYPVGSIEEARKLHVEATECMRKIIDNNEKIRLHLNKFPFPVSNIHLGVAFEAKKHTPSKEEPTLVYQVKNKLIYKAEDQETGNLIQLYEEPYDEAYKIVMGHSPEH